MNLRGPTGRARPRLDRHALIVAICLAGVGAAAAIVLAPSRWAGYSEPSSPQMTSVEVRHVANPEIVGSATGQVDRVTEVPGGFVAYGWVAWPSPDSPSIMTTAEDVGPGVAYDRPDVIAALGGVARRAGFQLLLGADQEPCLMVESGAGLLSIPGGSDGC